MNDETSRPLSVVIPTTRGWPEIAPTLDALRASAIDADAEVLVGDASAAPDPPREATWPGVRWLRYPGASVFQLRAALYSEARSEIVAATEDHCRPRPDWCRRILEAHAARPDAVAIGGAVENATRDHLVDWAAFFLTQSPFMAPLRNGETERTTGAANISFKRRALARLSRHGPLGTLELLDADALRRDGDVLLNDDTIVVDHEQSMGILGTSAIEFHNGRTVAGFRRRRMTRSDWLRIAVASAMPVYRTARTARIVFSKRRSRRELVASLPWLLWLQICASAGELQGYAAGPGESPRRLR